MAQQSKKTKTIDSYQHEKLVKDLERLKEEAAHGSYQAQMRYETIQRLVDPTLEFCDSDLRRILNKGHSPQVQKGLRLYRMMRRLTMFVEPVGKKTGPVCHVRLIPFEKLTWEMFLDTRFPVTASHLERASRSKNSGKFNGEAILDNEERKLLKRLKPYFGSRKRPTLQSLAISLLNEEGNGKGFSERALYNYLDAVREHRLKKQTTTATSFSLTFYAVDSFGKTKNKTVRESLSDMKQIYIGVAEHFSRSIKAMTENLIRPALSAHWQTSFHGISEQIGRCFESIRQNALINIPPKDFGQMIAKIAGLDILPRINQYKNLQG